MKTQILVTGNYTIMKTSLEFCKYIKKMYTISVNRHLKKPTQWTFKWFLTISTN